MARPRPLSLATIGGAPPPGSLLCKIDDIQPGQSRSFTFRDGDRMTEIFLHRRGDDVFAYLNRCPHAGTPLDWVPGRFLAPDGTAFLCGTHGARFAIEDGYCFLGPCTGGYLRAVMVELRDGGVHVPFENRPFENRPGRDED